MTKLYQTTYSKPVTGTIISGLEITEKLAAIGGSNAPQSPSKMLKSPCLFGIFPTLGNQVGQSTQTTYSIETTWNNLSDDWGSTMTSETTNATPLGAPSAVSSRIRLAAVSARCWSMRKSPNEMDGLMGNIGKLWQTMGTIGKPWAIFGKYGKIIKSSITGIWVESV